ncbi:ImmA/IrrE family metallo-endopeptidase [Companilactobacillus alimentarius]
MSSTLRVPVYRDVLDWAIKHGEKSLDFLNKKYYLNKWKNPDSESDNPTLKQLQSFSNDTKIPFHYFLSSKIPYEENSFVKYRTVNNNQVIPSRRLIETIHMMESRQEWMRDYLTSQNKEYKFKYSRYIEPESKVSDISLSISHLLDFENLINNSKQDNDFYKNLKEKISSLGIMIMQNGCVGSNTKRPLDPEEFRAFALYDDVIPLIFIDTKDSYKAKIFSLLHELLHVFLNDNEILNVKDDGGIEKERWINSITIEILIPYSKIPPIGKDAKKDIIKIAKLRHTSIVATTIRLNNLNIFPQNSKDSLISWAKEEQAKGLELKKSSAGGGNYYKTLKSRVDPHFAMAVISSESTGNLSINTASSMLGSSVKNYSKTVNELIGGEVN